MNRITRRRSMQYGAGAVGALTMGLPRLSYGEVQIKEVDPPQFEIEDGAQIRVLRPSKFVAGDEELWNINSQKFAEQYGVPVIVDYEGWEDLRPKTAVAASVGQGADIILGWREDPHLYPGKTVILNDLNTYLGEKYGGWFDICNTYGMNKEGDWISLPVGGSGSTMVARKSMLQAAGYDSVPGNFPGFLDLCKKLNEAGTPAGLALGNAVGDGGWVDWVLWAHGSSLVDENNQVVIDNPKTIEALEYAKELSSHFIPGVFSWLDPSNNKAFLANEVSLTSNGISIYYAAKTSDDPAMQKIAEDIIHADFPIGPVGTPTQGALVINAMVMQYTDYPNAAKEYLRFMMEQPQYEAWQNACLGYWCHPLVAYDGSAVWTDDPKSLPYKNILRNGIPQSFKGDPNEASAAVAADMVVLNMFQAVCAGQLNAAEAAKEAQRRAERYYKT